MKIVLVALYGQGECKMVLCATPPLSHPLQGLTQERICFIARYRA